MPTNDWNGSGINRIVTTGTLADDLIDGVSIGQRVFLGNGAASLEFVDFFLPHNGLDWIHSRVYSSLSTGTLTWQGHGWWCNEMMNLTVSGSEGASNVSVQMDPHYTLGFTYSAGSWTCDDKYLYTLTFDSGNDEYLVSRIDGHRYIFHDSQATNAGKLKRIEDSFGNDWTFTYSSGQLTDIVVDVVVGSDHKITYTYFTSGDNSGQLQYVKVYKTTTTTDANLIGKVEYVYHGSASDDYGLEDDLMKVIISHKATTDGDGTLSMGETYYYRYYKGTYNSSTNPGTDHQLKYVLYPENADRLGTPESQNNTNFSGYANIIYEYDSSGRVRRTDERLPGSGCGCGGGGGTAGTTTYTWSVNGSASDVDTWKIHCVADRADDTRVIFDVNRVYQILTWVVQDQDDGTPNTELIWHFDYGTSGDTENRLTAAYNPSACSDYDESAPYSVTLRSGAGVVHTVEYDTGTYARFPKKLRIKKGSSGSADTLVQYARTITERPDLATTVTRYESASEADGRSTTFAYTFYDGAKLQIKQIDTTFPSVSTGKNGPNASAVTKSFFDKRTGALRWTLDGEGYVNFRGYDTETGVENLMVNDANTSSLLAALDTAWDGVNDGGLATDDTVPFSRSGNGTALDIDSSSVIDWLGRVRKTIDAGGMITYTVYKDDETRFYPAWNTSTYVTLLPFSVTLTDKDGRPEEEIELKTSVTPTKDGSNEPTGAETYANSDMASRMINVYSSSGSLTSSDRYHTMPGSGTGTRYTNFYRTAYEYDTTGGREFVITDVADESTYDREQITRTYYDFLGRVTKTSEGVSDNSHDITVGKPTLYTLSESFYDDPDNDATPENGAGDGNLSWNRRWFGTGGSDYNDTHLRYDDRNRLGLTIPPAGPYTLVKYDNLGRATVRGRYSASTNLDPGDDPATTEDANRQGLSKTYYDEAGRVYKTESYDDPSGSPPANALVSNTYYDRNNRVWATDGANTGIGFTIYDGAGRRTQTMQGTQFDAAKYTSSAPDYPDGNEGIVHLTTYTLDDTGSATKIFTYELNHNDTNGYSDITDSIASTVYHWYDAAHRLTDTANYGTYSTTFKSAEFLPFRGASAPARSDTVLVTTHTYDSEGRQTKVKDPKAIETLTIYDKLGRVTQKEENDGGGALERITTYQYNAEGSLTKITADLSTDQVTEYAYADAQSARRVTKIKYPATDTDNGKTLGQPSDETYDRITFTYNVDGTLATRTDQNATVLNWSYDNLRRKTEEEVTTLGTYTGGAGSVDSAIRAVTWTYDSEGRVQYLTTHTDTTPDTSTWTDAENQIKYTFDAASRLTKEEQEEDGAVDGSTKYVEYGYGTDYSTGNYNRLNWVKYPDSRKIWNGYTHSGGANTFQDTINDTFNRVGQICKDSSGSKGDILAEYDMVGMGRLVRRVHDEDTGKFGNDTKLDLWQDTSGDYKGLDRFGRIIDMKYIDFSGSAVDYARLKYGHDRNGNRTSIEDTLYKANSQSFTYDNLNRLTDAKRGILNTSNVVQLSDTVETYGMDLLGNFTSADGGVKVNAATSSLTHAVNATNEITTAGNPNPAGATRIINEPFTTSLSNFWTADKGTWSISSDQVNVDTLTSGDAVLLADAKLDVINYELQITFPTSSSSNKAGLVFAHNGSNSYHAVVLNRSTGKLALYKVTSGSWGSALQESAATINDSTAYTISVTQRQRTIDVSLAGQSSALSYGSSTDFGMGKAGMYSDKIGVKFDNFKAIDALSTPPAVPRIGGSADVSLSSGQLLVNGATRGGEAVVEKFTGGDYLIQVVVDQNGGTKAEVWIHYQDSNNGYKVEFLDSEIWLKKVVKGQWTTIRAFAGGGAVNQTVQVRWSYPWPYRRITVYVEGVQQFYEDDSTFTTGGVALGGTSALFDNLKIGTSADNDLDDVGDTIFVDESFGSTDTTVTYDKAGNLIDDGSLQYVYDAWNRLVKVRSSKQGNAVILTAEFDGIGRRIEKVVTNTGTFDATWRYFYDGQKIVETRDGSGNMVQQFIHGTRYIDELILMRVKDKGDLYVHQDANWNVIALTDLGGSVVERYVYKPYGEVTVHQDTGYGDRDGDGDVDSTDKGTVGSTCTGTVTGSCRILDLDFDGDYDSNDATKFDALSQGSMRTLGLKSSAVSQPFAHQGLLYEPEIAMYQVRARGYVPMSSRFIQRDPKGYSDSINPYFFAKGNSIRNLDPMGRAVTATENNDSILIQFQVTFWGFLGDNPQQTYQQVREAIGLGWGIRNVRVPGTNQGCKKIKLKPNIGMWSGPCDGVVGQSAREPWFELGPSLCYTTTFGGIVDEAGTIAPADVSIWIRGPVDTFEANANGGTSLEDRRRIWVKFGYHTGNTPERTVAHELGHFFRLEHAMDADYPHGLMRDGDLLGADRRVDPAECRHYKKFLEEFNFPGIGARECCTCAGVVPSQIDRE
ncbi:MAG: RHS repeat-associated core domain-containing protein [Planctomycetota bacterium]